MSGNMAFFFLTWWPSTWWPSTWWLYLVALPGGPLPGGSTWWLYLVALYLVALPSGPLPGGPSLPGASMCCTLHHFAPPITLYQPSQNKMGQSFKIVVMIKKDSTNTMQINGLRYVK